MKLSTDINNKIVKDELELTKEFNSYYINIEQTTSGVKGHKNEKVVNKKYKNINTTLVLRL